MGDLLRFPERPRAACHDAELILLDRTLAEAEETLDRARGWLPRLTGWVRIQALLEIARLEQNIEELGRRRLRLAGPELALIRGGKA